jgi:hypothetical protein
MLGYLRWLRVLRLRDGGRLFSWVEDVGGEGK